MQHWHLQNSCPVLLRIAILYPRKSLFGYYLFIYLLFIIFTLSDPILTKCAVLTVFDIFLMVLVHQVVIW